MITLTSGWKMTVSAAAPTFAARRPDSGMRAGIRHIGNRISA
ncbi:hypothetical protein [Arthrobacter sp. R-11]